MAVLFVLVPEALVGGAVCVVVNSVPTCFVIDPLSFVFVAVSMPKFTLARRLIIQPFAFVAAPIWPNLLSPSLLQILTI